MEVLRKAASVQGQGQISGEDLELINRQTLRTLTADEVFVFRLAACDDQVDRDCERFTVGALEKLAEIYPGKPVLMDHRWSTGTQTARVYSACVEQTGETKRLVLQCYMPRTEGTRETIAAIESGVLRECSVGVSVGACICSVCGANNSKTLCIHNPGCEYDGNLCHMDLDEVLDAYEVSLVAVPAQKDAGVLKSKRYGGMEPSEEPYEPQLLRLARSRLELEKNRYGGK